MVTEISASPDGSPYVLVSLKDPKEVGVSQRTPFVSSSTFSSTDDMFRNLGRVISKQMMGSFATVLKLSLNEYDKLDIKVGDRVSIDIDKVQLGTP